MPIIPGRRDNRQALIDALSRRSPLVGGIADFVIPGGMDDPTLGMMPMAGMVRGAGGFLRGPFQKALPAVEPFLERRLVSREGTKGIAAAKFALERLKRMMAGMDESELKMRNMLEQFRSIAGRR